MTSRVALTFDAEHPDRPTAPGVVDSILDTLRKSKVHTTFFLQGRWVEAYPDRASRVVRDDHVVGNHSFYHARMPLFSESGFLTDVEDADRVIRKKCGADPRPWFRCPFGSGAEDERTARLLSSLGYRDVGWNVEPGDWHIGLSGRRLARETIDRVRRQGDGAIVLLHTWPRATAVALPQIIDALRADGSRFVGVDELIDA